MRTGCKAMIRLLRTQDHAWYISRVVDTHNHVFSECYGENKQWKSHSDIDPITKDLVKKLKENNISVGRICNILGVSYATSSKTMRKESIRFLSAKLSQENMKDDIGKTMSLLEDMKKSDPGLECTGKNRVDYANFGDAIAFDTTYMTNLYNMPFGLFVVLLTSEKTEDFEWAFSKFVEIMNDKAPVTMLTDQCAAMAKAIKSTLPNTRHGWCRWHVHETNITRFEEEWGKLIKKYRLVRNKYLKRLFKHRDKWAKPYFMYIFCAGMTSTQRSESANHMLKRFIQRAAPMHLFVSKFNELQSDRHDQEGKERHVTKQARRKLRVGVPIEHHANTIYTRAMYEKEENETNAKHYRVKLEGGNKIWCECGLYEHMGMLCRRTLKVLVHVDKREIPAGNILRRWTKEGHIPTEETSIATALEKQSQNIQRKMVLAKACELAKMDNRKRLDTFVQGIEEVTHKTLINETSSQEICEVNDATPALQTLKPTSCPPRTIFGGRPPNTGLKSWLASNKKVVCQTEDPSSKASDWPEEEKPPKKKMKSISELALSKQPSIRIS
ncbi:hypothetical protein HU200_004341 [Digitaria exilis]|uniref:Protein FAR1-RELATED SEQUENCE n=1 Tax=Digitaria exilis TaxID=1010633 RepID=A0A835KXD6_9POAL|nr:hypothetical protein HU200_004341 [Digitaria exilis]